MYKGLTTDYSPRFTGKWLVKAPSQASAKVIHQTLTSLGSGCGGGTPPRYDVNDLMEIDVFRPNNHQRKEIAVVTAKDREQLITGWQHTLEAAGLSKHAWHYGTGWSKAAKTSGKPLPSFDDYLAGYIPGAKVIELPADKRRSPSQAAMDIAEVMQTELKQENHPLWDSLFSGTTTPDSALPLSRNFPESMQAHLKAYGPERFLQEYNADRIHSEITALMAHETWQADTRFALAAMKRVFKVDMGRLNDKTLREASVNIAKALAANVKILTEPEANLKALHRQLAADVGASREIFTLPEWKRYEKRTVGTAEGRQTTKLGAAMELDWVIKGDWFGVLKVMGLQNVALVRSFNQLLPKTKEGTA